MIYQHLHRLLALYVMFCSVRSVSTVLDTPGFEQKVSILLKEEPENPKCFVKSRKDFTCFWEEEEASSGSVDQYSFTYTYKHANSSRCPLRVQHAAGRRRFFCHVDRPQFFVQTDIQVHRQGVLIHNRSLLIEFLFLLDPPMNLTVASTGQQGQLNVSWVAPPLKYMGDSMLYEVRHAVVHSHQEKVDLVQAGSELILRNLHSGSKYKVQVRVTMDGISYGGFWSAWSEPVFMETPPAELDLLIMSLTLIISFILVMLSLTILLSHRRFVIQKIWPTIPTPDSKFQGLFTVYGGDFQSWLGQTDGGLWLTSDVFYSEECPSPLEVLSELSSCPSLPPKASRPQAPGRKEDIKKVLDQRGDAAECWRPTAPDHWLMERLRALHQNPVPCSQSSLLESQDAYVTLSNDHGEEHHLDDALEEALPLEVLFTSRKTALSESHSDLGSVQQSSVSGRLSSQSSFEFPHQAWTSRGAGYTYMAMADSGVSMDYSPMSRVDYVGKVYANEYKNHLPAQKHFLPRPQPFHHGL